MKYLTDVKDVKIYSLSELITSFREKNIPCEKIRFFVNEDRKDPKCFGIYQDKDTGNFIVYKNKSDGTRFIRYNGSDEKQAVDIFFEKLKEEMALRENKKKTVSKKTLNPFIVVGISGVIVFLLIGMFSFFSPKKGYYIINNEPYYYSSSWWYYDDVLDDWYLYDGTPDDYRDNYYGNYSQDFDFEEITDSNNYNEYSDSDFDDYDYDSWDSSDTNWDSDW